MKTIFKKSKVYDEALELQKKIISILTNLQAISESISLELRKLEDELRESEDEEVYREIYSIVHCYYKRKTNLLVSSQDRNEMLEKWKKAKSFLEKQKEQKPAWSKEDKTIIDCAVEVVEKAGLPSLAASLKYLRPQPHWKPSEEQMNALKNSAYGVYQNGDGPILRELYEQLLKKL